MSGYDGVRVSHLRDGVALVTFGRPPHNFLEGGMIAALADAYEEIAAAREARVIVLASEGKNFCAGADFSGIAGAGDGQTAALPAQSVQETYGQAARLIAAPLPVIAAVQGAAVGGGFGLACTADFRVGSPETRLAANFAQLGVHHGLGLTVTLPLIVGWQRAHELLLTGKRLRGAEGQQIGLLDRLVEAAELRQAAIALAEEIAASAPLSIRAIRATMREGLVERFRAATLWESQEQARLSATADFREGVRASAERRRPAFTGQ